MSVLTDPSLHAILWTTFIVTVTIRTWIAHRTTVIRERALTERIQLAINGSDPLHRPDILRACNGLKPASPDPEEPTPEELPE